MKARNWCSFPLVHLRICKSTGDQQTRDSCGDGHPSIGRHLARAARELHQEGNQVWVHLAGLASVGSVSTWSPLILDSQPACGTWWARRSSSHDDGGAPASARTRLCLRRKEGRLRMDGCGDDRRGRHVVRRRAGARRAAMDVQVSAAGRELRAQRPDAGSVGVRAESDSSGNTVQGLPQHRLQFDRKRSGSSIAFTSFLIQCTFAHLTHRTTRMSRSVAGIR